MTLCIGWVLEALLLAEEKIIRLITANIIYLSTLLETTESGSIAYAFDPSSHKCRSLRADFCISLGISIGHQGQICGW